MLRQRLMLRWTSLFNNRLPKGVRRKRRSGSTLTRRLAVETLEDRRMLTTITVTTANDAVAADGFVSLREAIMAANTNAIVNEAPAGMAGLDTIAFNIPGAGPHTISPTSDLPMITEAIIIDGYTQPGATVNTNAIGSAINTDLRIELDGTLAGAGADGLQISAGGSTIRGLVINRFSDDGIQIDLVAVGNTIEGNFIGTDVTGEIDLGNGDDGIVVFSADNTIGGTSASARNLISGNNDDGVEIEGALIVGNMVVGNFIGTDKDGDTDLGNSGDGVRVENGVNNTIGGTTTVARNVISGNNDDGVEIEGALASSNTILGNFIGTDLTGTLDLGNNDGGVFIDDAASNTIGGTVAGSANVISGNSTGIQIVGNGATGNMVLGNFIGTDVTGTVDVGNTTDGILILEAPNNTIGGTTASARNIISGNGLGVEIDGNAAMNNVVLGNYIGTDVTGTVDLGNNNDGVLIDEAPGNTIGGTVAGSRNLISGNDGHGVFLLEDAADNNVVAGNYIGTDVTGTVDLGNSLDGVFIDDGDNNTIGGTAAGAGNLISGNNDNGVHLGSGVFINGDNASGNMVLGNLIGTDVTGTSNLGNSEDGVLIEGSTNNTIGGTTVAARNVISGNGDEGVEINGATATGNTVQGNFIGTAANGTDPLGNATDGVEIVDGSDNLIGGTADGAGNVIAFNSTEGVEVAGTPATGNAIRRNSIYNNGTIGIDLSALAVEGDGVTANDGGDPDVGANLLQNFPQFIGNATLLGNSIAFRYRVNSVVGANATYPLEIEFFVADSNNQEGQTFLATDTYLAAEAQSSKDVVIPAPPVLTNNFFVATATDAQGNTSEFSAPVQIVLPTILGSEPTLIRPDEFININQINRYQYIAHSTGKMVVRIDFLHLLGDLDLEVRDENGNLLAMSNTSSADQNFEEVILPVVGQEKYFISVIAVDFDDDIGTPYALEIENFPAPVPTGVHLDPASDTGVSNKDDLTNDTTPTFFIQTDVLNFVDTNNDGFYVDPDFVGPTIQPPDDIHALTASEAQAILDGTPEADDEDGGIAVQVTLVNTTDGTVTTGFADAVVATLPEVYRFTPNSPLTPGVYFVTARTKVFDGQADENGDPDQAMGRSNASPPLWFTIDTLKPNVFFGDAALAGDGLDPASDSGVVSQPGTFVDRITNDTTPTFFGTSEANATVRVFVLNNAGARVLIGETVATPFNGNNPLATGRWTLTSTINMNDPALGFAPIDGLRQFEVEAEDVAGNLSQGVGFELAPVPQNINDDASTNFTITVDNFVGPITDLDVGLDITHPALSELTATLMSPNGTIVQLFTGLTGANLIGTILDDEAAGAITTGVAPYTGPFQPTGTLSDFDGENPNGDWTLAITDNAAGNIGFFDSWSLWFQSNLDIFVDTQGPQVNQVTVTGYDSYDLFDPKDGPTPSINSLTITVVDQPNRLNQAGTLNDFLYSALVEDIAETPGNYSLVGDQVGAIAIENVIVTDTLIADGQPAFATIELQFFAPLPDDRFTLTVSDNLVDPAGNNLDGESNANQPQENPQFPSGDGIPGGDFVSRFIVDSRAEIGAWASGSVLVDTNGNFFFDPTNTDSTNRDIAYRIGFDSDYIFAGKFSVRDFHKDYENDDWEAVNGGYVEFATGFDTIAAYGRVNGNQFRWLIDTDDNGVVDLISFEPVGAGVNGYPVAGNFDGNPLNGDEVGLFDGQFWYFDTDHDFNVSDETPIAAIDYSGFPIAGDFDGDFQDDYRDVLEKVLVDIDHDGDDDVATYIATSTGGNLFSIDLNQALPGDPILIDGIADFSFQVGYPNTGGFGFAGVRERPVAADFNADGIDDFGLWVPDGIVPVPNELSEWYLLLSGDDPFTVDFEVTVLDRIQEGPLNGFVPFSPEPFGNDLYAQFGNTFSLPIAGNFDPPVSPGTSSFVSQALTSLPVSVSEVITPTIEQTETQPVLEELSKPVKSTPAAVKQPVEEEVVIAVVQVSTEVVPETPLETLPSKEVLEVLEVPVVEEVVEESVETKLAQATETEPVQSSLREVVTAVVETKVATPAAPVEVVAKQVPAEPEPIVVAASESVVDKVTTEAPTEEIPVALVDRTVPTQSYSRVRSLSFGGSLTVASVSTLSVPPPVVKPAEPQLPVAVEIVVETPTSEEFFQAPVVETATNLSTSNLLTSGTTKSIPNEAATPITLVLAPDPSEVVGEDAGNPGLPAHSSPSVPVSEQSKGDETDSLSQDTTTDQNVSPSTSLSRTRTLIYVQGQSNDPTSPQTSSLATENTADTEQLAYSVDLTNDVVDPTPQKTAMTDAAFDSASLLEFNRVDAEVVDELSRLNQDSTEEFGSRIQHDLITALAED